MAKNKNQKKTENQNLVPTANYIGKSISLRDCQDSFRAWKLKEGEHEMILNDFTAVTTRIHGTAHNQMFRLEDAVRESAFSDALTYQKLSSLFNAWTAHLAANGRLQIVPTAFPEDALFLLL